MKVRLTLTLALLLICSGAALAQTPDGETPAQETVCDDESGAAYGLCNAYCEAMDCDGEPQASATACTKVQNKFTQLTGRDVPCEVVECPCAGTPAWDHVLTGAKIACDDFGSVVRYFTTTGLVQAGESSSFCGVSSLAHAPIIMFNITPEQLAACMGQIRTLCGPAT